MSFNLISSPYCSIVFKLRMINTSNRTISIRFQYNFYLICFPNVFHSFMPIFQFVFLMTFFVIKAFSSHPLITLTKILCHKTKHVIRSFGLTFLTKR